VSLEWHTESPPIQHNFAEEPSCDRGPYDFDEIASAGSGGAAPSTAGA
jgi:hypothetical protein